MADWAISPTQQTDWQLDPDEFERALGERFPGAETERVERYGQLIGFTVPLGGGTAAAGYLAMDRKGVWVDGGVESAAPLAEWLRERTPESQELALYDQALEVVVPLEPGATAAGIVAAAQG